MKDIISESNESPNPASIGKILNLNPKEVMLNTVKHAIINLATIINIENLYK